MVAPVRCATPGTEVDWAYQPCASASATIQSANTPPPCPPMARTAIEIGRSNARSASGIRSPVNGAFTSRLEHEAAHLAATLQETDHGLAQPCEEAVDPGRVVDDVRPVE